MVNDEQITSPWWSAREVAVGRGLTYVIGPFTVKMFRGGDVWWLWTVRDPGEEIPAALAQVEQMEQMPEDAGGERFVFSASPGRLQVRPLLADRSVVFRAYQPVFVPPGEEATLFLSSPVWISLDLGEPARSLREMPVQQMSDTWFGPSTREGELCYAARTSARSHLEEVPRRAHRAVTPVRIRNEANSLLPIEKLSLPAPLLSVYGDADRGLWTEEVHLTRTPDSDLATLRVVPGPSRCAPHAELLSGPRRQPGRGGLVRAFSDLFG
ncbi:hypothetical protein [Geoalkalibacter halelectricus]|uniref:hypothetical protein n=1 Tax=Geoalkalibacter halelectricus TaxID=2847045 RepID=UPI003D245545